MSEKLFFIDAHQGPSSNFNIKYKDISVTFIGEV
jgi:hypothetical protein